MRIMIINPTTTEAFTRRNLAAGRAVAAQGTEVVSIQPAGGPASIEGHYDEAVSVLGILEEVRRGEAMGMDGYVIACFGDPGVDAAREVARGPVIGIADAAMRMAAILATGFSIVTTLGRTKILAEHLVHRHGYTHQCRRIRATDLPVLSLEDTEDATRAAILAESRAALAEDGSGAIVLGCAGMADLARDLQAELGVPVVEGVAAGVKLVESAVALGLFTSKRGDYAPPLPKPYRGRVGHLSFERDAAPVP